MMPLAAEQQGSRRRRAVRAVLILLAAVGGLVVVTALYGLAQGDPAIARRRGEVTSIKTVDGASTEVCIRNTTDAGSTYGDPKDRPLECLEGLLEGITPTVGSCVVLQVEGEASYLRAARADRC
jgi:hypothetical protein